MNKFVEKILSIPKSLYVSIKLLPLGQAIKLPIFVRYNCHIVSLKGSVKLENKVKSRMLNVGFGKLGIFDKTYQRSIIQIDGVLVLKGNYTNFGQGAKICIMNKGILSIGKNFNNSGEIQIVCYKKIDIKDNVLISWNTLIMDTDFHQTINIKNNISNDKDGIVTIGNNVWMGARSTILKNSFIPNGCIIAANACCNKKYEEENCLLAGIPAKIHKRNITRKK